MKVIPVINCPDIECVRKKIEIVKTFLPDGEFLHLDVSEEAFTGSRSWGDPIEWTMLKVPYFLEVHLMVEQPEDHVDNWLAAGARRLIIHLETINRQSLHEIVSTAERYQAEIMISSKPESISEELVPYFRHFSSFQILAVSPGPAGQKFLSFVAEKVRFIREELPDAIIEVDGGMNPETAPLVRDVGADIIVSSNYIFNSADPKKAYEELKAL